MAFYDRFIALPHYMRLWSYYSILCTVLLMLSVAADESDPYGFGDTTGSRISGREFLLALSVDNPTSAAVLKVHNLNSTRNASVLVVTSWHDNVSQPRHYKVSSNNVTSIRVVPPTPTHSGPFVVNVTSTQNITLVAMRNGTLSFGGYTVYPISNAGRWYEIVSFPSACEEQQAEVVIIGVDDGPAYVTFKSRRNISFITNSTNSFRTMSTLQDDNKTMLFITNGELSKAQAIVFRSIDDLTGSTVTASSSGGRVAVISSSYCPNQSCDLLMEQIPPMQTFGSSYFIVPTKNYKGDNSNSFRILPIWDNTTVSINSLQAMAGESNSETYPLSRNEYFDIDLSDSIMEIRSIKATKPVIVMHYLIKSDDPLNVAAMTLIPSVEQYASGNITFSTYNTTSRNPSSIIRNFVNIITECNLKKYVLFNNYPIGVWTPCPPLSNGGSSYCAVQKQMPKDGVHTLRSTNSYAEFSAVQYGIRTDKSAFANTVFMGFDELTCDVSEDGDAIPCSTPAPPPVEMTTLSGPTTPQGMDNMTTVLNSYSPPTNGTKAKTTSRREKAGTVLAIIIGVITLIAGIVALAVIANAACGKRSKWKRLHNQPGDTSITLDQNMVEQDFVHHASGNHNMPFINGFYLYVLTAEGNEKEHATPKTPTPQISTFLYLGEHFQEEWFEITVPNTLQDSEPSFLSPNLTDSYDSYDDEEEVVSPIDIERLDWPYLIHFTLPTYKNVILDMTGSKSDRTEWCHVNYESCYNPDRALELQIEWLVATPSLLLEMLPAWTRKAVQCGFHLIPAPVDPFNRCIDCHNPLTYPRTISLHVEHLVDDPKHHLFQKFDKRSRNKRLYLFQEAILRKFGFVPARDSSQTALLRYMSYEGQCEYVHVSGTAFAFIDGLANKNREPRKQPHSSFPPVHLSGYNQNLHSNYQNGHMDANSHDSSTQSGVYFLWAYNYLMTKRWRTSSAGDEKVHDKLLADFISFCNNEDGRLSAYWQSCQKMLEEKVVEEEEDTVCEETNGGEGADNQRT